MIEPKLIRPGCRTCLSWDFRKQTCLRIMHGMACVVGDLPPRGAAGAADNAIYKKIADNYDAITEASWHGTPLPRAEIPGPDFHSWRQDSLANFAAEVYAEYKALKAKLAKIEEALK